MSQSRPSFPPAVFVVLSLLLGAILALLLTPWAQAQAVAFTPVRLNVVGAEKPIELRQLDVKTEIAGRLAQTTVEMTFYNPNARVLEGELQFPLLEGQTITGFALSMDGPNGQETMRDAVPVEKVKGRQVFEDVVRQNIDPALLEATQGNNFKLRVYPLNAGKTRRVRLVYSERLVADANGNALYRLPLAYAERVGRLNVGIETAGLQRPPFVSVKIARLALDFHKNGKGAHVARAEATMPPLQNSSVLAVTIPVSQDGVYVGERNGKRYFLTEVAAPAAAASTAPKTLNVLWDASASGRKRDHAREFAFLDAFFARVPEARVRLQVVRDVAETPRDFVVKRSDWGALRKALDATVYDGATNLAAFDFKAASDLYLLFSDGLDNYSIAPAKAPAAPLFALVSSPGAETARLRGLAANGGGVIDLTAVDAKSATARTLQKRPHIVTVEGGVSDVVWQEAPQGGGFLVVGVVRDTARPLHIAFSDGSAVDRRFPGGDTNADAVPYLWASLKIARLEEEYDLNRGEIRRIGRVFRIPTRETSLIVLDRVADYVTHDIEPPPELKNEYDRLRAQTRGARGETGKLARVLTEWKERKAWWEKDFPKGKPARGKGDDTIKPSMDEAVQKRVRELEASIGALATPATAPPPPLAEVPSPSPENAPPVKIAADSSRAPATTIALRPWSPDAAYIRRMKEAKDVDLYRIYLDERPDFENSIAFYLDVSYELGRRGQQALALRVLSNLAEMNLENRQILRVLGYRLLEAKRPAQAVVIFKRVLALADDEPQSFRDLGLAHEAAGDHQQAIDRLYDVVEKSFARRFPGIEVTALTELNAIVATAPTPLDTSRIDPRFLARLPLDLRVVLTWDTDETDIDLHVIDPNGEETYFKHRQSYQGGLISLDNTVGYGPEEFVLRKAKAGKYRVEVNFYGHSQQMISEATTIQLDFFTHFGTRKVKNQAVTMRLKDRKDKILVGEFDVK
jgi:tetratricopeptide (TPR) repeat protein